MWKKGIFFLQKKGFRSKRSSYFTSIILTIVIFVSIAAMLTIFMGQTQVYSPVTNKCISCHNDTGYPNDTDGDGVAAPYKRPHNNNVMCESCHETNPHTIVFIQPSGMYGSKATAASCPDCHQAGIPPGTNSNFTNAFMININLRHSSDLSNGSVWGSYWTNSMPKTACLYCHDKTYHNISPLGRILLWSPDFKINGSIGSNFTCAGCHYKESPNYTLMNSSFIAAGLQIPPEITNGTNWNGTFANYFNHTIMGYTDNFCKECHGRSLDANATLGEFIHNVTIADVNACMSCHTDVNSSDLGRHSTLSGTSAVENSDCKTCHYQTFPMVKGAVNNSNTYFCADCHTSGGTGPNKSSIIFSDKKHGTAGCMDCHVADGKYHQGNPRGSVANITYVNRYVPGNTTVTDCADCHYASNLDDVPFNAPGGGTHITDFGGACIGGCHGSASTMPQKVHNLISQTANIKPSISVPILSSSSIPQGTPVIVNATVTSNSYWSFVDGAQYRIMSGATEIVLWTPMSAAGGDFNGSTAVAIATIMTNITPGNYIIQVRGMAGGPAQNTSIRYYPMNGDVSAINSTNLTILAPLSYINGTVTSGDQPLGGALVLVTGGSSTTFTNGFYSIMVAEGTYNVTASKRPEYYDNTTTGTPVTPNNTTIQDFILTQKPTGNITGTVTNATG
ncbi:Cytochrome c7 c [uncultured archaeon]|nr:Cytochrome c7 c [uncultured archaeon]